MNFKKDFERKLYELHLAHCDEIYEKDVRLLSSYRGKNGYGSKLQDTVVHEVRGGFEYARRLLWRGNEEDCARAYDLLYRVLSLQEINPARPEYGVWPYYIEERLDQMAAVDYNWADFNAKTLLMILHESESLLTDDLRGLIKEAIHRASISIMRRDVDPSYTNISFMGTCVTLCAGDLFGWEDIYDYGMRRLENIYEFNKSLGNFCEFNSPTYTVLALQDISDLLAVVKKPEVQRLAKVLCRMCWEVLARHFHASTRQLAGPHYRGYAPFLSSAILLRFERACGYRLGWIDEKEILKNENIVGSYFYSENLHCPEDLLPFFLKTEERIVEDVFMRPNFHGECFANKALQKGIEDAPRVLAYTYLCERYTLGSVHREEMWNQHKNLLGYFGTKKAPYCVALRFLHDDWDFCSCFSANVQEKGKILSALGFVTDRGDTHCNLDLVKDATVTAEDLRLTWQISGQVDKLTVREADGAVYVESAENGLSLLFRFPFCRVAGFTPRLAVERKDENTLDLSLVLYHGERREVKLAGMDAGMVTTLEVLCDGEAPADAPICEEKDGVLSASFAGLSLSVPMAALPEEERMNKTLLWKNRLPYGPNV